ncbi:MAG TPA: hypothetical protein DIT07_09565 [Sphingobacteriaceae bacterium]|nr:hypothetical protein [Sphingobacteriaceae bacterium]
MNLRGLVAVSGKPGLFKLLGQNKSGFILESLDEQKVKIVVNISTAKLASLEDITVFGDNTDLKLADIFASMKSSKSIPDPKADGNALRDYFTEVAPEYDKDRVYTSDIKKIIGWFSIIKDLPLFTEAAAEPLSQPSLTEEVKKSAPVAEEKVKPVKKPAVKGGARLSQKSK